MVADDHLQYSVTAGMPEIHRSTEFWNTKLVIDMEAKVRGFHKFEIEHHLRFPV
jgi:hypothetical protein